MAAIVCKSINELIGTACHAVGKIVCFPCMACNCISREICSNNNFCTFLLLTVVLNGAPIVTGIQANIAHGNEGQECHLVLQWLAVNCMLCLINILAAAYIVATIGRQASSSGSDFHRMDFNKSNTCSRVNQVVCYDPIVAIYLLFLAGFLAWHVIGPATRDCNDSEVMGKFGIALAFGWFYLLLGGIAFGCGVMFIRRN